MNIQQILLADRLVLELASNGSGSSPITLELTDRSAVPLELGEQVDIEVTSKSSTENNLIKVLIKGVEVEVKPSQTLPVGTKAPGKVVELEPLPQLAIRLPGADTDVMTAEVQEGKAPGVDLWRALGVDLSVKSTLINQLNLGYMSHRSDSEILTGELPTSQPQAIPPSAVQILSNLIQQDLSTLSPATVDYLSKLLEIVSSIKRRSILGEIVGALAEVEPFTLNLPKLETTPKEHGSGGIDLKRLGDFGRLLAYGKSETPGGRAMGSSSAGLSAEFQNATDSSKSSFSQPELVSAYSMPGNPLANGTPAIALTYSDRALSFHQSGEAILRNALKDQRLAAELFLSSPNVSDSTKVSTSPVVQEIKQAVAEVKTRMAEFYSKTLTNLLNSLSRVGSNNVSERNETLSEQEIFNTPKIAVEQSVARIARELMTAISDAPASNSVNGSLTQRVVKEIGVSVKSTLLAKAPEAFRTPTTEELSISREELKQTAQATIFHVSRAERELFRQVTEINKLLGSPPSGNPAALQDALAEFLTDGPELVAKLLPQSQGTTLERTLEKIDEILRRLKEQEIGSVRYSSVQVARDLSETIRRYIEVSSKPSATEQPRSAIERRAVTAGPSELQELVNGIISELNNLSSGSESAVHDLRISLESINKALNKEVFELGKGEARTVPDTPGDQKVLDALKALKSWVTSGDDVRKGGERLEQVRRQLLFSMIIDQAEQNSGESAQLYYAEVGTNDGDKLGTKQVVSTPVSNQSPDNAKLVGGISSGVNPLQLISGTKQNRERSMDRQLAELLKRLVATEVAETQTNVQHEARTKNGESENVGKNTRDTLPQADGAVRTNPQRPLATLTERESAEGAQHWQSITSAKIDENVAKGLVKALDRDDGVTVLRLTLQRLDTVTPTSDRILPEYRVLKQLSERLPPKVDDRDPEFQRLATETLELLQDLGTKTEERSERISGSPIPNTGLKQLVTAVKDQLGLMLSSAVEDEMMLDINAPERVEPEVKKLFEEVAQELKRVIAVKDSTASVVRESLKIIENATTRPLASNEKFNLAELIGRYELNLQGATPGMTIEKLLKILTPIERGGVGVVRQNLANVALNRDARAETVRVFNESLGSNLLSGAKDLSSTLEIVQQSVQQLSATEGKELERGIERIRDRVSKELGELERRIARDERGGANPLSVGQLLKREVLKNIESELRKGLSSLVNRDLPIVENLEHRKNAASSSSNYSKDDVGSSAEFRTPMFNIYSTGESGPQLTEELSASSQEQIINRLTRFAAGDSKAIVNAIDRQLQRNSRIPSAPSDALRDLSTRDSTGKNVLRGESARSEPMNLVRPGVESAATALKQLERMIRTQEVINQINPVMNAVGEPTFILFPAIVNGLMTRMEMAFYGFGSSGSGESRSEQVSEGEEVEENSEESSREGKPRGKRYQHRVRFRLSLGSLGEVEIDFKQVLTQVMLTITVSDEDAAKFIEGNLDELRKALRSAERIKIETEVRVGKPTPICPDWVMNLVNSDDIIA